MTTLDKQIIEEGPRNAVVRLTGVITDADQNWHPAIALSDFKNNEVAPVNPISGLRVDAIIYSIGNALELSLYWNANTPRLIAALGRSGKMDVTCDGGLVPVKQDSGYDGSINLVTSGFPAGTTQNFTITLRLVKLY